MTCQAIHELDSKKSAENKLTNELHDLPDRKAKVGDDTIFGARQEGGDNALADKQQEERTEGEQDVIARVLRSFEHAEEARCDIPGAW